MIHDNCDDCGAPMGAFKCNVCGGIRSRLETNSTRLGLRGSSVMLAADTPQGGAWRSWSANAPMELLDCFNAGSRAVVAEVRRRYPADCGPKHPAYQQMKSEATQALDDLAETIQGEHDAIY